MREADAPSRSSGTPETTSSVTRWNPRGRGRSVTSRWIHMTNTL